VHGRERRQIRAVDGDRGNRDEERKQAGRDAGSAAHCPWLLKADGRSGWQVGNINSTRDNFYFVIACVF